MRSEGDKRREMRGRPSKVRAKAKDKQTEGLGRERMGVSEDERDDSEKEMT